MLSDEEKQAIEGLKGSQKWIRQQIRLGNLPDYNQGHYADIQIVLNLIEKQSKEIEELKEEQCCMTTCLRKDKEKLFLEDKIKAKIEEKFLEAKGLYERGVQPQAQYTMKLLRDLEKSLLEKE